jgi:hypothetical protein
MVVMIPRPFLISIGEPTAGAAGAIFSLYPFVKQRLRASQG